VGVKSFLCLPPFYLHQHNFTFMSAVLFTGSLCLLNMHHIIPTPAITSTSLDLPHVFVFISFVLLYDYIYFSYKGLVIFFDTGSYFRGAVPFFQGHFQIITRTTIKVQPHVVLYSGPRR